LASLAMGGTALRGADAGNTTGLPFRAGKITEG